MVGMMVGRSNMNQRKLSYLEEHIPRKKKIKCFFCGRKDHFSDKCSQHGSAEARNEFVKGKKKLFNLSKLLNKEVTT